jgi:hypothetical protein
MVKFDYEKKYEKGHNVTLFWYFLKNLDLVSNWEWINNNSMFSEPPILLKMYISLTKFGANMMPPFPIFFFNPPPHS